MVRFVKAKVILSIRCHVHVRYISLYMHPSGVAKSSTSFGWGKGGKVISAGWQVTLCDLIWHVISRSGVVISITNCYIRFTLPYLTLPICRRPSVRLSSVCNVRAPYSQAIEIFGNVSTPFNTLGI